MPFNGIVSQIDDIGANRFVSNFRNAPERVLEQCCFAVTLNVVQQGVLSGYFLNTGRQFRFMACHKAPVQVIWHESNCDGADFMLSDGSTKQSEIDEAIEEIIE